MAYAYSKNIPFTFSEAVAKARESLKNEGFGIITEIDVKSTMKAKLGIDFDNYVILGACNPASAHRALLAEREIGLMLPCNVIVHENEGKVFAACMLPSSAMATIGNPALMEIAKEVEEKLKKAMDNI